MNISTMFKQAANTLHKYLYGISTILCLNYNSTIFKTITSSVDESRKTIALFNKDWNTYKTNWQQGFSKNGFVGGVKSIFQPSSQNSVISKDQIQILRNWNNAVEHGCKRQSTFNRIIANADDNTKMYFAGLNKGKGSIEGLKNAQNVAKHSTIGLTIAQTVLNAAISFGLMAAITLAIKGFDKLINSAKRASEAADEAFSDTNEKVQQNEEEAKSLDQLISKYKELKENGELDVDGRKEVKELQNNIADLVGTQAKNLDLVNGKLDDEIKKLDEITAKEAKRAYETATANYYNSKKAYENATGDDSFLFVDGWDYVGKREKEAEEILKSNGFSNNISNSRLFWYSNLQVTANYDNNFKELKNAQEKADYLQSMIDVLEQNGQRGTDLYAGLIKQRDAYLKYIDNQQGAAESLVNSWITYSQFSNDELSKINVNSVESFDTYRQKMIDEAKNDETIGKMLADGTLSNEDLEKAVNNFMATSLNFSKWYEQWQSSTSNIKNPISLLSEDNIKTIDDYQNKLKELYAALNLLRTKEMTSSNIDELTKNFPELSEYIDNIDVLEEQIQALINENLILLKKEFDGVISEEALKELSEYPVKAESIDSSINSTVSAIDNITSAYQTLNKAVEEYNENGYVSLQTLEEIMKIKPEYLSAFIDENGKIKSNTDAYKELVKIHLEEYELSAKEAYDLARKKMRKLLKKLQRIMVKIKLPLKNMKDGLARSD